MTARSGALDETSSGEGARTLTAADIAALVGGELRGDPSAVVKGVAAIDRAGREHATFLASGRYAPLLARSTPGVLLVTHELAAAPGDVAARIVVSNPQEAMLALLPRLFAPRARRPGIDPTARLGRGVRLGSDVEIGPYAVLGDGTVIGDRVSIGAHTVTGERVVIGDDCLLHPHVTLYTGAVLGRRVILHSGVRVAADGFGYVFRDGAHQKIPHVGRCVLEDDVEIGANSTVDRGSIDDTVVGAGTKIDNLVQVAHNVRIGRLCLLMSQVGVAGSTRIGDGCILAGQAGVAGHLEIGDGARVAAQAGVIGDVPAGETWSGYPARPHREALRSQAALNRLSPIIRRLEELAGEDEA